MIANNAAATAAHTHQDRPEETTCTPQDRREEEEYELFQALVEENEIKMRVAALFLPPVSYRGRSTSPDCYIDGGLAKLIPIVPERE